MEVTWIKISTDMFNNRKIRQIEYMTDGDAIIIIWMKLLILAGELNDGGKIYLTEEKPYTEELLSVQLGKPREIVALALRTFEAYGMIDIKDGFISISNWEKYQNIEGMERIREQNRDRQKKWYDTHKKSTNVRSNVSTNDDLPLPNATEKRREEKNREEKKREESLKRDFQKKVSSLTKQWQIGRASCRERV